MRSTLALAALMAVIGSSTVSLARDRKEIVTFSAGATAKTLKGSIRGSDSTIYTIRAKAGQVMQVLFSPSNRSCYFNVNENGAAEALHVGSMSGNEFGRNLKADGVFALQVYLMRNAARRNETCRYQLSVEITGARGGGEADLPEMAMRSACMAAASIQYGVPQGRITLSSRIVPSKDRGFALDGDVDKGPDGVKKLSCRFNTDHALKDVMAMTPDGE